jgi:hypothetical protein
LNAIYFKLSRKKSKGRKNDEDCILKGNWYNGGRGEDDEISGSYF